MAYTMVYSISFYIAWYIPQGPPSEKGEDVGIYFLPFADRTKKSITNSFEGNIVNKNTCLVLRKMEGYQKCGLKKVGLSWKKYYEINLYIQLRMLAEFHC